MFRFSNLLFLLLTFIVFTLISCSGGSQGNKNEPVFKEIPELVAIKPEQPVKIKLKRNASGSYSWEVQGGNTEKIIEADRKLRESIRE
jgi:predicted secreted protein